MSSPQPETQVQAMPGISITVANSVLNSGGSMFSNLTVKMHEPPKAIDPSKAKQCPNPSQRFTGREDALKKIAACFFADDGEQHIFVLHGLGGAGKTQIAYKFISEYCYKPATDGNSRRIPLAFHLDASTSETLEASFKQIASSTGLGTTKDDVLAWLSSRTGADKNWVLLFDNADDIELDLRDYFPSGPHGNILITTRNADAPGEYAGAREDSSYWVKDLKPDEARALLRKVTSLSTISDSDLDNLAESLGHLALALVQAGSAIRNWKITVPEYLEEFRKRRAEIFRDDGIRRQKLDSYSLTVYTTWIMSYNKLSPVAKEFLGICSFLYNKGILEEFFRTAAEQIQEFSYPIALSDEEKAVLGGLGRLLGNVMEDEAWNTVHFRKITAELSSYSLLHDDGGSYSIHLLVHQWARTLVADEKLTHGYALALFGLQQSWNDVIYALKVIPHLQELMREVDIGLLSAYVAEAFGCAYLEAAWAEQAEQLLGHVMDVKRTTIGQDHKSTLRTIDSFAEANSLLGKWKEAEEMHSKVLEQRTAILGENHPDTIESMHNLAWTLQSLGKLKEAEEMQSKVVEQRRSILGETHPDTIGSMHNLASILESLGKLKEAEEMQSKVVEQWKAILGETHPGTIAGMNNLAGTLQALGKLKEAEEMLSKVVEQLKVILGENHPDTIKSMHNLAAILESLGKLKEAEEMQRKVVEQRMAILGENHPDTIRSMQSLAWTLQSLVKLKEAEEMQSKVVEQSKVILGENHPDTIGIMHDLAWTFQSLGKLKEAEEMQSKVVEQRKAILGETHPYTIAAHSQYESIKKQAHEHKENVQGDAIADFAEIGGHEVGQEEVESTEAHAESDQPRSEIRYPPTTHESAGFYSREDLAEA